MKIPVGLTRTFARTVLKAKKHSPHIFFAAGVIGMTTTVVLACRATLKLEKSVDDIKTDFHGIKTMREDANKDLIKYSEQDYYRDMLYLYGRTATKITILYAPTVTIGTLSIAALTGSHIQLTRRNAALTATLAGLSKAFDEYRMRVREEIGEERELEIHRGIRTEEIETDGIKELVKVTDPGGWSPFVREFNEDNPMFRNSQELNRLTIHTAQNYANHMLHARGHYFLNDAYDSLGFPRTVEGSVVGWLDDGDGAGFIDFGLFEAVNQPTPLFDIRRSFILDFNVDGVIFREIEKKKK
jgi:Family of unknown function (DUF6353)